MQVEGGRGHLRRIKRHLLALGGIGGVEEILDGETGERVVEMDDQRLAREDLQRRRRIEIVPRSLAVGRRAADELIGKDEHVLHRLGHGIEASLALLGDQPYFEHAVLARERHRLAELGPHGRIEFGACLLCPSG
jgi:hypothetical protein